VSAEADAIDGAPNRTGHHGVVTRLAACLVVVLLAGCAADVEPSESERAGHAQPVTAGHLVRRAAPGTTAPPWLGTRTLEVTADGFGRAERTPRALRERRFTLPDIGRQLPGKGFAARVRTAPGSVISRSTWQPGCPVAAADLAWVRVAFWGFDDRRHTGELLVHASVARDVVSVFRSLYTHRFPLEEMRITRREALDAPPTGDGNNTAGFVCRPAVGQTGFSQHAYGLAVDLNPFQNPYVRGDGADRLVLPELASAYADRHWRRPGMVLTGSVAVAAFARVGWEWGGSWHSLQDHMHFSQTGR
jgi:hypothetical protein